MKRFLIFGVLLALGTSFFAQTASDFEVALTEDGNGEQELIQAYMVYLRSVTHFLEDI
jgi:hypothetical protein